MIFQETWERVLDGSKTQTRRAVKSGDCTPCAWKAALGDWYPVDTDWTDGQEVAAVIGDGPRLRFGTGTTVAVQPGRGKHAIARIAITSIRYCQRAGDISTADAIAEGFTSPAAFCAVYGALNGNDSLDRPAWAISFQVVTP